MNTTHNKTQIETGNQDLESLLISVRLLLDKIANHPHYQQILEKGYSPDLTLGDAQTAIAYLQAELD